jgi:hypothetical protein
MTTFPETLRTIRRRYGVTQDDLARWAGLHRASRMTAVLIIAETPRHAARIAADRHLPDGAWIWMPNRLSAGNYMARVWVQFNVAVTVIDTFDHEEREAA